MKVITRDRVKVLLGIADSSYDIQIDAQIPMVDAAVKQICRNNFNLQIYGEFVAGSDIVELYSIGYDGWGKSKCKTWPTLELEHLLREIPPGTMLEGDPVASDAYISEVYYSGVSQTSLVIPSMQMNDNATASGDYYIYAGMNIAQQRTVAKGIWWAIGQVSTGIQSTDWKSRNVGPLSITRSEIDSKIDGKSGMPAWFVKAMPRYHS